MEKPSDTILSQLLSQPVHDLNLLASLFIMHCQNGRNFLSLDPENAPPLELLAQSGPAPQPIRPSESSPCEPSLSWEAVAVAGIDSYLINRLKWRGHTPMFQKVCDTQQGFQLNSLAHNSLLAGVMSGARSVTLEPVCLGDQFVGVLLLLSSRSASQRVAQAARRIARQLAHVLPEQQWQTALVRRTKMLATLFDYSRLISSSLNLHEVLQHLVEQVTVSMNVKCTALLLFNETTRKLVLECVYGSSLEYLNKPDLDVDTSLVGQVVLARRPLIVQDVRHCSAYLHTELARKEGFRTLLAVPLAGRDKTIGVMNVYSSHIYDWQTEEITLLRALASQSAIAIQNAWSHERAITLEEQLSVMGQRSAVGELAAGVAHEIRNPLSVVSMLVESTTPDTPNAIRDREVIVEHIKGINRCVQHLLELSKPIPLELSFVRVDELVEDLLRIMRIRIQHQDATVVLDTAPRLPVIRSDAPRIRQIFVNLLLNSLQAMKQGGGIQIILAPLNEAEFLAYSHHVMVDLPESRSENQKRIGVLLCVRDDCGGIAVDNPIELFRPFASSKHKNTGLGLSIVRRLVSELRGHLALENKVGEGMTFRIWLPESE